MRLVFLVLYNVAVVPLLFLGAKVASLMNSKIRTGLRGRKETLRSISAALSSFAPARPRILIHVSSYGEFLQVKPVLNRLKQFNPELVVIISFFSPSGYEPVAIEPPIDWKCYLPFDSYLQTRKFIAALTPRVAAIVRHDVWPNFVWRLKRARVPLLLIDASIPQQSSRFFPILKYFNRLLFSMMDEILAISEEEARKLQQLVNTPAKIKITGDTKYDQVFERSHQVERIAQLLGESKLMEKKILVVGSSWPTDEEVVIPAFQLLHQRFAELIMILAPHEPSPERIETIAQRLEQAGLTFCRLSHWQPGQFDHHCLIIDQIGLLANIYYLAAVAIVGGSFHYKIHNVLEPAVYGIPVLFGPKMTNSSEAQNLLAHDAAILVRSTQEIVDTMTLLLEEPERAKAYGERARHIVIQNVGSAAKVARLLLNHL